MYNSLIFLLSVLYFIPFSSALTCSSQFQCMSVSSDYNFVKCVSNHCQCLPGFNGTATAQDPCRCDYTVAWGTGSSGIQPYCKVCNPPRRIQYDLNGVPYCVNFAECEGLETASDTQTIRINVIKKLYSQLVYPTPLAIMTGQLSVADIFAQNVRGRVSPVGTFGDFTAVDEYFYGLGASAHIDWVNVTKVSATGDYVSVWIVLFFNNTELGMPSYNLTQTGFFTFDSTNKITSMDLDILNLGWALDADTATNPVTRAFVIARICTILMVNPGTCKNATYDPDGHYTDFNDCVSYMSSITFGTWAHANANSVICRELHTTLTPFRPAIHCPHAGKTGGMKCIDTDYSTFYATSF